MAYIRPRWLWSSSEIHYHLINWIVFNLTIISLLTQIAFHRLLAPYAGLCLNINKSWLTWRRCQLMSFITQVFAEELSCLFRNAQIQIAEWFWSIPWRGKVNVMCFCILHGTTGLDTKKNHRNGLQELSVWIHVSHAMWLFGPNTFRQKWKSWFTIKWRQFLHHFAAEDGFLHIYKFILSWKYKSKLQEYN